MSSNDPNFEQKAADIIGLYLNPPAHAAVFCVDEKTAIQALDRNDPVLPLSPGRAERHGFEYYRHGTLALYAAFNTKTGEVIGKTAARHTSEQFVAFLTDIVAHQPTGQEIHVIADNLSAHKTQRVEAFLSEHPTVQLHFTPTYSSWLNQVELWFAKISRDVITRGVFSSVADLKSNLMRYIRQYNKKPRVVKWHYVDPSHDTSVHECMLQSTRGSECPSYHGTNLRIRVDWNEIDLGIVPNEHAEYLVGEALPHLFDTLKVKYDGAKSIKAIQEAFRLGARY